MNSRMQWYYAVNGQRVGPVSHPEFVELVRTGAVRGDTLVWRQGMGGWQPYREVAPVAGPVFDEPPPIAGGAPLAAGEAAAHAGPAEAAVTTESPTGAPAGAWGPTSVADETAVCAVSGRRYPKRDMIQHAGKWIGPDHRDEYFRGLREGLTAGGEVRYAGFWIRFLARFIDMVALWIVAQIVLAVIAAFFVPSLRDFKFTPGMEVTPETLNALTRLFLISGSVNLIISLIYEAFFVARFAATPGKLALGLRIMKADGTPLSLGRNVGRFFAQYLNSLTLGIGYIIAGIDDQKRGLHDFVCNTRVVHRKR